MTTIKDIARISGYSIGTVSRVINKRADVSDHARQRVQQVIEELQFSPNNNAKMLKQQADASVHIVVRGYENMFFEPILEKVQQLLNEAGEETTVTFLGESDNEVAVAIRLVREQHPRGLVFLGGNLENFRESFSQITVPSVLLTNTAEELQLTNLSSYTTDDETAACEAVNYLISLGHTSIGLVGGSPSRIGSQVGYRRLLGSRRSFSEHNLSFNEELQYEPSPFSMQGGYEAAGRLLDRNPGVTAIFAFSDTIAIGVMRAAKDRGLSIPGDISVLGFDGIETTEYTIPRLSTVKQNGEAMAEQGVQDLLIRMRYSQAVVNRCIPFLLEERESTARVGRD